MNNPALVVGASGIIGSNLARELLANHRTTYGLTRRPGTDIAGLQPVAASPRPGTPIWTWAGPSR